MSSRAGHAGHANVIGIATLIPYIMGLYKCFSHTFYHDIVAEWSKAPDLGSGLSWRRFKSCRCHFLLYLYVAT